MMTSNSIASQIEAIIEDATCDAYGFDEQLWGWLAYLEDELTFPFQVRVLGQLLRASKIDEQFGHLKLAVDAGGEDYWVDATDVIVVDPASRNFPILVAFRHWLSPDGYEGEI
ncbi:MAG TPA: calcium-binding protein [Candidatus Lokiarchaeia archaeon]|nr:calcium-binding protein [Candidatus Lokiarchaeia archaeon]